MSMCRVFSCVVGSGCLLWPVPSLGKTLLIFALLHFILQGETCLLFQVSPDFLFFSVLFIYLFYFTILHWFFHTLTWIHYGCTCVPHTEPPFQLPPHPIPLNHPSAPAPSTLYHASNLDWQFVSHMVIYMFQCCSLRSSHPCFLPWSPKVCSIHLCLFFCLAYRVIVTIFLNSIYMC